MVYVYRTRFVENGFGPRFSSKPARSNRECGHCYDVSALLLKPFNRAKRGLFEVELDADASVTAATGFFLPGIQFSGGYTISAPGFSFELIANIEMVRLVADSNG